jgi:hypothetical protein
MGKHSAKFQKKISKQLHLVNIFKNTQQRNTLDKQYILGKPVEHVATEVQSNDPVMELGLC